MTAWRLRSAKKKRIPEMDYNIEQKKSKAKKLAEKIKDKILSKK